MVALLLLIVSDLRETNRSVKAFNRRSISTRLLRHSVAQLVPLAFIAMPNIYEGDDLYTVYTPTEAWGSGDSVSLLQAAGS